MKRRDWETISVRKSLLNMPSFVNPKKKTAVPDIIAVFRI
jgi:hypothetical protein